MITMKVPTIVDAAALKLVIDAARKCGTSFRIETFYRIVDGPRAVVDCDDIAEVIEYGNVTNPEATPPRADLGAQTTPATCIFCGRTFPSTRELAAHKCVPELARKADAVDPVGEPVTNGPRA